MIPTDEYAWSQQLFGHSELGDARRTARLVDVAARMAQHLGSSLAKSCDSDPAVLLGSYRLLRNDAVQPEAIRAAGFAQVAACAQESSLLLAIEDTTSLSYHHAVAAELGLTGGKQHTKQKGFLVHSVLLVDAEDAHTVGLIAQQHWCRDPASYGKSRRRKQRRYPEKESYHWQETSHILAQRLGGAMPRTLSVCDREADIYDYLCYKQHQQQRFVVRAQTDRCLFHHDTKLFETVARKANARCGYTVAIPQRGGRPARLAKVVVHTVRVRLAAPESASVADQSLPINVVLVQEVDAPASSEPLHWVLLTSEAIDSAVAALQVVHYYELRWRIEEYHKAWKSGIGVERQRFQRVANLERMVVITAFLAVRLLQLRELLENPVTTTERGCNAVLAEEEWTVLWLSTEPNQPVPEVAPSANWAFYALAKLGGFTDTKRTGRVGWDTLWRGWFRLQERLQGYLFAQATGVKL